MLTFWHSVLCDVFGASLSLAQRPYNHPSSTTQTMYGVIFGAATSGEKAACTVAGVLPFLSV